MEPYKRIENALDFAFKYGQIDGEHHKEWVIDQMVRILCGDEEKYKEFVTAYELPVDDDYYIWGIGIAP